MFLVITPNKRTFFFPETESLNFDDWTLFRNWRCLKVWILRGLLEQEGHPWLAKGGYFSESAIRFSDLQTSKKNIPKSYPEFKI